MFRLFHDNNIDFLGHKSVFIMISVVLMLIGCAAVAVRGFNLGVDFAGGSLYHVQFSKAPSTDEIRQALDGQGIDSSKVIIQPISGGGAAGEGMLIRLPQEAGGQADAQGGIGSQKRLVLRALSTFNAGQQQTAVAREDINLADEAAIATELRLAGVQGDLDAIAAQVVAHRNGQPQGIFRSIDEVRSVPNLPPDAAGALTATFYAGKSDINLVGGDDFYSLMRRVDPLGVGGDPAAADQRYTQLRDAFVEFRDRSQGGVISSIDALPDAQFPADLKAKLGEMFYVGAFNVTNAEAVGAQVGEDLRNRAIYVTLASLIGMLIYIAFRFEWIYGVSAVVAVFHDVPVTLGIFALFGWEINLTVIAALLTLIGYSVNDTIVIFDRIRESLKLNRRDSFEKITNDAINATLSRTVIASGTAFLTVLSLLLFGGDVLRSFAMVLFIGIVVGTYSSIAIASPVMLWLHRRQRVARALPASPSPAAAEPSQRRPVRTAKTI
jgi:preprotein translocase SecF subunit